MAQVLVVDDIQDNITLLSFALEDDEFEVLTAVSGEQCLEIARSSNPPDIILLDIHMPGMDGIEALRQIKADEATLDIPVIMLSADTNDDCIVEAIDLGAHDFVTKPIEYPVLAARMRSALRLANALEELAEANQELVTLATTDSLTGAYNRRHFFTLVNSEINKMSRHNRHLSILMIDIDHFKRVNDTYGHAAGDKVIRGLAMVCKEVCRSYDIVARLGGEEFAVCSPDSNLEGSLGMAERLRQACENMHIENDGQIIDVSISIGLTEITPNESFEYALNRADELLYEAKNGGRNRVVARLREDK